MSSSSSRRAAALAVAALTALALAGAAPRPAAARAALTRPAPRVLSGKAPGRLAKLGGKVRGALNALGLCKIRTPVNMSNRHWHPTAKAFKRCFGALKPDPAQLRPLSQPGEYATNLRVDLDLGGGKVYRGVRVLWPPRAAGQAELAPSDFASLGLSTPAVNDSGNHRGTIGARVSGPKGSFSMKQGVMAAATHVHVSAGYAVKNGLKDGERVDLTVNGARSTTFRDVKVRINPRYAAGAVTSDAHIDKDQAGAAAWSPGSGGTLRKHGPLRRLGRWLRGAR